MKASNSNIRGFLFGDLVIWRGGGELINSVTKRHYDEQRLNYAINRWFLRSL
jgi:hypothetical protein